MMFSKGYKGAEVQSDKGFSSNQFILEECLVGSSRMKIFLGINSFRRNVWSVELKSN